MKRIILPKGQELIIDDEDYVKVSSIAWNYMSNGKYKFYVSGHTKGSLKNRKRFYVHRFIMNVTNKNIQVDHIDGDTLNNTKSNLRLCSNAENNLNKSKISKNSSSIYKGVTFRPKGGRWEANIQILGTLFYIGRFNTEIEAAIAYNRKAIKLHGEFAKINKIAM